MAYRGHIEQLKASELDKARQLLAQGQDAEQVLERLANALTAKLAHAPSQLVRQAAMHENPEILEWSMNALGIEALVPNEPAEGNEQIAQPQRNNDLLKP